MDQPPDKGNPASEGSLLSTIIKDFIAPTDIRAEAFWSVDPFRSDVWLLQIHLRIGTRYAATSMEQAILFENQTPRYWLDYHASLISDLPRRQPKSLDAARVIARTLKQLTKSLKPFSGFDINARTYREIVLLGRLNKEVNPGEGRWRVRIDHRAGIFGTQTKHIDLRFNYFKLSP